MKKFFSRLLRFFAGSAVCACCGADLYDHPHFCESCLRTLPFNNGPVCNKCGRATEQAYPACLECKADMPAFDAARSAFRYEGEIVRLIKQFKNGHKYLAEAFAHCMVPLLSEFETPDLIVSVPMTESAQKRRGYNQSELLAREVSTRTGIVYEGKLLVKTRETDAQKTLTAKQRSENLRGSLRVHERVKCRGKRILIVDDVLTTGATTSAAAQALLRAGALRVYVLTAASVPDKRDRS